MTIRSYLGCVLAGTVMCGLAIAGYFSWSFISLERMQYEVSSHSLALRELNFFGEGLDLLLVSSDLTIGSGETYAAQIAQSLSQKQRISLENIARDNALPYDQGKLIRLAVLFKNFESLISSEMSAKSSPNEKDRSELLSRFDALSSEIVTLFEDVLSAAEGYALQKSNALEERRTSSRIHHLLMLGLYFIANALIVFWSLRKIAWPVENLTRSATRAISDGSHFEPSLIGPKEIRGLATHFVALVSGLEQTVLARTQALQEKTKILENEVTERKQVEIALSSAKEAAEKSNKVKSEFLSVMSHELRTPMNAVLGSLSLIRDSGLTEEQETYARIADESGHALLELLGDVLDISKIEAETIQLKSEPFAISSVISSTREMLTGCASVKGLRTSALIDPDVPEILIGDHNRLRQILINLINNAIKFTEEGSIDIGVSLIPRDTGPNLVRFDVTDSGVGIAESDKEKIFDTFSQLDSSLSRAHSGVGLGLPICRYLAREMGGDCDVKINEGNGSTFWFTVALSVGEDTRNSEDPGITESIRPVLIINHDDAYAADWVARLLDSYNVPCSVVAGLDAAEAHLFSGQHEQSRYGCIVIAARTLDRVTAVPLEKLAARAHSRESLCMVLSEQPLDMTRTLISKGLVDLEHIGCLAQYELLTAMAGQVGQKAGCEHSSDKAAAVEIVQAGSDSCARVLIVEDSEVNRLITTAILGKAGHHAVAVNGGAEAIRKLEKEDFDVILMDLQMPEMNGLEASELIRALPGPVASVPIIAFSANIMESTKIECSAAGINDFVSKPFETKCLLAKIAKWASSECGYEHSTM